MWKKFLILIASYKLKKSARKFKYKFIVYLYIKK